MKRSRLVYLLLLFIVVILGLASRSKSLPMPSLIAAYGGDTLWALMVFLGLGFLFPSLSTARTAAIALVFSFLIEISQLYQAPWINALRDSRPGALILGHGFLWSDLLCYTAGVILGTLLEKILPQSKE
jgi:hypothetical protein